MVHDCAMKLLMMATHAPYSSPIERYGDTKEAQLCPPFHCAHQLRSEPPEDSHTRASCRRALLELTTKDGTHESSYATTYVTDTSRRRNQTHSFLYDIPCEYPRMRPMQHAMEDPGATISRAEVGECLGDGLWVGWGLGWKSNVCKIKKKRCLPKNSEEEPSQGRDPVTTSPTAGSTARASRARNARNWLNKKHMENMWWVRKYIPSTTTDQSMPSSSVANATATGHAALLGRGGRSANVVQMLFFQSGNLGGFMILCLTVNIIEEGRANLFTRPSLIGWEEKVRGY